MEQQIENTSPLLPAQQEEQKQVQGGYFSMFGQIAQSTAAWTAGKIKSGAELIETQLKDPDLGTKIKQGATNSLQWTKDKFNQAKETVQDPEFKEKFKKTIEQTGQTVKQGADVLWEDLKKGATTLKKEFIPSERAEEDENNKKVFDNFDQTAPPPVSLSSQMYESMDPPKIEQKNGAKDDQLFNPFA